MDCLKKIGPVHLALGQTRFCELGSEGLPQNRTVEKLKTGPRIVRKKSDFVSGHLPVRKLSCSKLVTSTFTIMCAKSNLKSAPFLHHFCQPGCRDRGRSVLKVAALALRARSCHRSVKCSFPSSRAPHRSSADCGL